LIGAPRSGKTLIGDFLTSSKKFKQFAFADEIKKEYFPQSKYSEKDFEWAKRYNSDLEKIIRDSLWEYSNIKKKECGKLYFISKVIDKINEFNGDVVITDIRTPEELFELEKIGVKFIVISRLEEDEDILLGTKIPFGLIEKYKKFTNWFDGIEELYRNFEIFFEEELMDAEEDSCFFKGVQLH
jgi:hypothetical protein